MGYPKAREGWNGVVLLRRGSCEHGNELAGCINCGKGFYYLKNYWLHKMVSGL